MNGVIDGGQMAIRFGETTGNLKGNKIAGAQCDSWITTQRKRAASNLQTLSITNATDINEVVRMVLNQSRGELEQYIRAKGEVPVSTLDGVIVQAALLRADDIATVSNATGMADNDSLCSIEQGESEALNNDTSDADDVLPPETMAALNIVINYFLNCMNSTSGSQTLAQAMQAAKGTVATPLNSTSSFQGFSMGELVKANSFDGSDAEAEDVGTQLQSDPSLISPAAPVSPAGSIGQIQVAPNLLPIAPAPSLQLTSATAASASAVQPATTSPSWTSLLGNIASTASTLQKAITGTAGVVSGTVNNLGAGSISTWINQNTTFLIVAAIIVIIVIILAARASRN